MPDVIPGFFDVEAGMIWLGLIAIVVVLGVLIWWGNRRAAEAQDEMSYLGADEPQPFRFRSVVPRWRKR